MNVKTIGGLLVASLLFGCASPKEVMYDKTKREPTTSIDLYREGVKPTKPYKEIGEIAYEDFGGEEAHAMKKLIAKAQKLGADGIIMIPRQDTGYSFNMFARSGNKYMWKCIAVVYQ